MYNIIDLPAELYLLVVPYLTAADLATLALLNRDHYKVVKRTLYDSVEITKYKSLKLLVRTITKTPAIALSSWTWVTGLQRMQDVN
jgi:hypothetical protein